jgi:hypothetical protein
MNFKKCFVVLVFATLVAVGSASATCSKATVTGVWGYLVGTAVGQFTTDGNGHITAGSQTVSQNGTIVTQTYTGTYSVANNCTGSLTLNFTGGGTATANIVLDQMNKGAQIIDTTSGLNASGLGAAEGTVTCGLTGKKATYAALLGGKYPGTGTKVDYVVQVILDGHGEVSGSGTFDVGGTITPWTSISGEYTESSNCTGTIQIIAGTSTLNFNFVVVAAGKEIFMIETDSGTAVGGFMQQ